MRRIDVAVGKHRNRHRLLDGGDGVVFGLAGIQVGAGAPVHCQRRDAGLFGDAGDGRAILVLAVPAGADLQRHRHIHRGDHGLENVRDQPLIAHQRRTGGLVADLLCRATHVDIDDLCAQLDVALRRFGEHLRVAASDLHRAWLGFVGMGHA